MKLLSAVAVIAGDTQLSFQNLPAAIIATDTYVAKGEIRSVSLIVHLVNAIYHLIKITWIHLTLSLIHI